MSCLPLPKKGKLRRRGAEYDIIPRPIPIEDLPSGFAILDDTNATEGDNRSSSQPSAFQTRQPPINTSRRTSTPRKSGRGTRPLEHSHDADDEDIKGAQARQEDDSEMFSHQSIYQDDDDANYRSDIARPSTPLPFDPYAHHSPSPQSPIYEKNAGSQASPAARPDSEKAPMKIDDRREELPLDNNSQSNRQYPHGQVMSDSSDSDCSDSESIDEARSR